MSTHRVTSKKQAPLATIGRPVKAKAYRATFWPFESTRYLDADALRKVARATIEIGTLEAPGVSCTLVAEIRKGMITGLVPLACAGCKPGRVSAANRKQVLVEVARRLKVTEPRLTLPAPLAISRSRGVHLRVPPIVIIFDPDILCVWIWIGTRVCLVCPYGATCD